MYKIYKLMNCVSVACLLTLHASAGFAANMDSATIKTIHDKVNTTFIEKCQKEMTGATLALCTCLGNKAQAGLDDGALANCGNNANMTSCVETEVTNATMKALTKDNVVACQGAPSAQQGSADNTSVVNNRMNNVPATNNNTPVNNNANSTNGNSNNNLNDSNTTNGDTSVNNTPNADTENSDTNP